ncbi:hypothetical protein BBK14_13720 [Parafrankia soli]|uniref:Short-chain dehydrogenase n=1 Tax=Parafrankia soli TaxID=2599596 RepID=A0A1S1R0N1_9ACTN|nr:hypothetical protein BBK14_13720 [Parafrankia soli]
MVTGAGSTPGPGVGTGKATAIVLAQAGASVLLVDIHPERAAETLEVIEKDGGTAAVFAGDMTSSTDAEGAVRAAADRFGSVDILVNNIGVAIAGTVADTSEADWDRSLALSLRTAFRWITGVVLPVDGGVPGVTPLIMADRLRAVPAPSA